MFQVDSPPPPLQVTELEKEHIEFNGMDAFKYENEELTFFELHFKYHECLANECSKLGVE